MGPQGGAPDSDYARATAALEPLMRGPSPAARGMGSLVDSARIREVLGEAGFADVSVTPVEALMDYGRDAADAAEFILSQGPVPSTWKASTRPSSNGRGRNCGRDSGRTRPRRGPHPRRRLAGERHPPLSREPAPQAGGDPTAAVRAVTSNY